MGETQSFDDTALKSFNDALINLYIFYLNDP